jgi:hypothetical protein
MRSIVNHPAPNIVPGVNFTAEHFEELYAWISSLTADTVRSVLAPDAYGLAMPFDGKPALVLDKIDEKLILSRCFGITPQGNIVAIVDEHMAAIEFELKQLDLLPKEKYKIYIEVLQRPRQAYGPESEDIPLRPLYSMPLYKMHVQQKQQQMAKTPDAFAIGVLSMVQGEWILEDYVPPCIHTGANELLFHKYKRYLEALNIFLEETPKIILQTDSFELKAMIELREFTMYLGSMLAKRHHHYIHLGEMGNPHQVFEIWSDFAQQASFLLKCLTDRPGFYNLINENTRGVNGVFFTPQTLDEKMQKLAGLRYDHDDILAAISAVDDLLNIMVPIFKALGIGTLKPLQNVGTWEEGPVREELKNKYFTW